MDNLRIVSWNIACGCDSYPECDVKGIGEALTAIRPDVVFLQEVDRLTPRSHERDLPQEICAHLGPEWHHVFAPALPYGHGFYGNAVLSKLPVRQTWTMNLGPNVPDADWEKENRSLAAALLEFGSTTLCCASTHLASNASRPSHYRKQQVETILDFFSSITAGGFILGGDFNVYRQSPDLSVLEKSFNVIDFGVTCSLAGGPSDFFTWDIDRFYIDKTLSILATKKMGNRDLSDHMLIMADLTLQS